MNFTFDPNTLLEEILGTVTSQQMHRPTYTSPLDQIPHAELRTLLDGLYKSTDVRTKLLATLLNSIFTEKKLCFLLSQRIMGSLLSNDPNQDRKTLNGNDFKIFMAHSLHHGWISKLTEEVSKGKATPLELKQAGLRKLLVQQVGVENATNQAQQIMSYWNSSMNEETSDTTSRSDLERQFSILLSQKSSPIQGRFDQLFLSNAVAPDLISSATEAALVKVIDIKFPPNGKLGLLNTQFKDELYKAVKKAERLHFEKVHLEAQKLLAEGFEE